MPAIPRHRSRLRPPRLRTRDEEEHSATWTELFYDLVFVVAVSRLVGRLLEAPGAGGVFEFALLFTILWWAWASFTFYANRYDTDDVIQRLLALGQMIAVAGMAASIGRGDQSFGAISQLFAASYASARLALVLMYWRAWRNVPETRTLVRGYLLGFTLEVVLWAASVVLPVPLRYVLWALGLGVSFATPWLMRREQARVPLSVSHLPERFGLFTILVLGESIAAAVTGVEHEDWALPATVVGIAGVVTAASVWWVYFDNLEGAVVRRDERRTRDWRPTAWIYAHLPLTLAIALAGAGTEELIVAANGHDFAPIHWWLAAGGVATAYLAMAVLLVSSTGVAGERDFDRRAVLRVLGAGMALAAGLLAEPLGPMSFALGLAAVTVLQVGADITVRGLWTRSGPVLRQTFSGRLGQPQLLPEHSRAGAAATVAAERSRSGE